MKSRVGKDMFILFEKKGRYKGIVSASTAVSILFLIIDLALCVIDFPYVKTMFYISILLSLISIVTYIIYDYKLESIEKYLLYLEDTSILNTKNIKRCLKEKEVLKLNREMERYSSIKEEYKLINRISLDTILRLKDSLEANNRI